jgi:hypothetical protein
MVSEYKGNSSINQGSTESTKDWRDPSLPIANFKLASTEAGPVLAIAAALALKVAEGAAARLGEKMIDSLFGSGQNYASLNRNAIAAISDVIKQSISEEALRQCDIKLQAMQEQMQLYNNAPDSNRFRLETALTQISTLVIDLKSFGVLAVGSFTIAATLHLGMLLEFTFRSADSRNLKSVKQLTEDYIRHAALMQNQLVEKSSLSKVTPCNCPPPPPPDDPSPTIIKLASEEVPHEEESTIERPPLDRRSRCTYYDDAENLRLFIDQNGGESASQQCQKSHDDLVQRLQKQLDEKKSAIQGVINNWRKVSSSL